MFKSLIRLPRDSLFDLDGLATDIKMLSAF